MKAHVLRAVEAIGKSGQNVLPCVLLHKVKAACPIHFPLNLASRFQGGIQNMDNHALPYLCVQKTCAAKLAAIRLLSALLRKKGRAVQDYSEAAFSRRRSPLLAGENSRLESKFPRIAVKNCLRHLFSPFARLTVHLRFAYASAFHLKRTLSLFAFFLLRFSSFTRRYALCPGSLLWFFALALCLGSLL